LWCLKKYGELGYARLQRQHCNDPGEASEVVGIVCKQGRNAIGQHRGHDIGIVNLFATNGNLLQQSQELLGYMRAILGNSESALKVANISRQFSCRQGVGKILWTAKGSQVLAQNLSADA
jgi:hypothetical protein